MVTCRQAWDVANPACWAFVALVSGRQCRRRGVCSPWALFALLSMLEKGCVAVCARMTCLLFSPTSTVKPTRASDASRKVQGPSNNLIESPSWAFRTGSDVVCGVEFHIVSHFALVKAARRPDGRILSPLTFQALNCRWSTRIRSWKRDGAIVARKMIRSGIIVRGKEGKEEKRGGWENERMRGGRSRNYRNMRIEKEMLNIPALHNWQASIAVCRSWSLYLPALQATWAVTSGQK